MLHTFHFIIHLIGALSQLSAAAYTGWRHLAPLESYHLVGTGRQDAKNQCSTCDAGCQEAGYGP